MPPSSSFPIPFGKYQLLERINVGGMAEVFKAKAFGVDGFAHVVAIKRILPTMAEEEEFIAMFRDEAKISVQLRHANIVHVYEFARYQTQYYIAMEYVAGKDLRQLLDRLRKNGSSLPIAAVAFIATQICEALDFAHNKADPAGRPLNVIHRDVSPQNILLSYDGAVKISDFGIVKADNRGSRTQAGVLKGKFGYMSPEQVRGLEIDRRSDLFAVGILLYEMVTGQRLFIGESDFSTLERVRNAEVTPPSQHVPELAPELEAIMLRALARERDERFQAASALGEALQPFCTDAAGLFNSRRLAALMAEIYAAELAQENRRMADFMRLPPPASAVEPLPAAPSASWNQVSTERTTIFASGLEAGGGLSLRAAVPASVRPIKAGGTEPSALMQRLNRTTEPPRVAAVIAQRRRLGLVLGSLGILLGLALGSYGLWGRGGSTGTLIVTSIPTTTVELSIDGEAIGRSTPLTRTEVPVGQHLLLARSPGYLDKSYHFDLEAGAPAKIQVELVPGRSADAGPQLLEIASEPTSASVRLGGLPQGVTPLTLQSTDPAHPLVLEIGKPGYVTQNLTIGFVPGEQHKSLHVRLEPQPPPRPVHLTTLNLKARPERSLVTLDGIPYGTTPARFPDLDADRNYALEVSHEGYRPYRQTFRPKGRPMVEVEAVLQAERRGTSRPSAATCSGTGGKLSLMPVGVADCRVTVGRAPLGVAPLFKHEAPVGRCSIEVTCPGGKNYQEIRTLRAGQEEKIVIKEGDWR